MKVLRNIVGKTKVDRIRSQQIRQDCGIQAVNEWVERSRRIRIRRRKWDEYVTRMDAERLVKISRDKIPAGRWSDLIRDLNRRNSL